MADWLTWSGSSGLPGVGGGALTADVVTGIEHESEAEITDHPIETGASISDHKIMRPKRVTFEFAQSEFPLRPAELDWKQVPVNPIPSRFEPTGLLWVTRGAEAALKALGSAVGLFGDVGSLKIWMLQRKEDSDRIHELHDQLLKLQKDATPVSFQYGGLVLSDYQITSVRYSRKAPGGRVSFTLNAQEVQTVATATSVLGGLGDAIPGAMRLLPKLPFGKKGVDKIEQNAIDHSLLVDSTLAGIAGF